ncbi:MAG TPA: DUF4097 family beta strand repeat-containing protein [Gemmatimonadales bacterium]|nr:DUF4097 family beta strand repeat-containing protein [Gemmatimonadales bacterium]
MTDTIARTAGVILAAGLSLSAQGKTFTDEIRVSPGQALELRLDTRADVTITGSDDAWVRVQAIPGDQGASDGVVTTRPTSRGVQIVSKGAGETRFLTGNPARLTIVVPRRFDVHITSMVGNLRVENVEGQIDGETKGGNLTLTGLSGGLNLTTRGGDIHVSNSRLDGKVVTMGGSVTLEDVAGHVNSVSMGGSVVSRTARRNGGAAPGPPGELRITTTGGAIDVAEAMAGAIVTTTGGAIHIQQAAGYVRATTTGGEIRLDSVDGWIEATTPGGGVIATMVGDPDRGDRHVRLVSVGGDITLTVPESLGMRFDITLAYTRNSRQNYEIHSDFPLQIRRTDWEYATGDRRRHIYGTGTAGNARHLVHIETVNGDVTVRKAP